MDSVVEDASWAWPRDMPTSDADTTSTSHRTEPFEAANSSEAKDSAAEPAFEVPTEPRLTSKSDSQPAPSPSPAPSPAPASGPTPRRSRTYEARTCRICFEVVEPTVELPTGGAASFMRRKPRVTYISEEPDAGRLISPCKCKGSQKYVHETCLKLWRLPEKGFNERQFWTCPTCGFEYRLARLRWGSYITSRVTRGAATLLVFALSVWILGFVADPILNLYMDPLGTIATTVIDTVGDDDLGELFALRQDIPRGWWEHWMKGFFSLGILGFVKTIIAAGPWYWFNLRTMGGIGGGRRRGGGQERVENISWVLIVVGVFTFLGLAWRGVGYVTGRILEKLSERVMDVQEGDDEDEDEDDDDDDNDDGIDDNDDGIDDNRGREDAAQGSADQTASTSESRKDI